MRFAVEELIAEGDRVWVRWTLHGTHQAAFLGTPPTGGAVRIEDCFNIFRVAGGRLAEDIPHWGCQSRQIVEQVGGDAPRIGGIAAE